MRNDWVYFHEEIFVFLAATPNADAEVETALEVLVKHPEVILLEDQHNANSNCLVLDVSHRGSGVVHVMGSLLLVGIGDAYEYRQ